MNIFLNKTRTNKQRFLVIFLVFFTLTPIIRGQNNIFGKPIAYFLGLADRLILYFLLVQEIQRERNVVQTMM